MTWKIIARHKWVAGAKITESIGQDEQRHSRFTATIRGWQNWQLYQGQPSQEILQLVISLVKVIRDRIDNGDEGIFAMGISYCDSIDELRKRVDYLETANLTTGCT